MNEHMCVKRTGYG